MSTNCVIILERTPGLTESERQRRLRAVFDILLSPLNIGTDAGGTPGVEIQPDPEAEP